MIQRLLLVMMAGVFAASHGWAAQRYAAKGLVLKVDKTHSSLLISCEEIPDYMEAMAMPFTVHNAKELDGLIPGTMIEFTLVVDGNLSYVEGIRIHRYEGVEQDPLGARRLKLIAGIAGGTKSGGELRVGEPVPDFSLVDQNRRNVTLAQFSGKVVAITFTYTHCALPNFCFRIANNFRQLQKRFSSQLGRDLVFMTITFDPVHDTPEVMAKYGKTWNADPNGWRLLTGSLSDVEDICNRMGISYWPDEGLMTHSLHTIVVDQHGNLVVDLEGNEFSAVQLGDLLDQVLRRPSERTFNASR
ncbi:MAG TPA: SCO family protein [Terriglobales bacterium]|nr:SCO family protein [Terriglobales bacterium]